MDPYKVPVSHHMPASTEFHTTQEVQNSQKVIFVVSKIHVSKNKLSMQDLFNFFKSVFAIFDKTISLSQDLKKAFQFMRARMN